MARCRTLEAALNFWPRGEGVCRLLVLLPLGKKGVRTPSRQEALPSNVGVWGDLREGRRGQRGRKEERKKDRNYERMYSDYSVVGGQRLVFAGEEAPIWKCKYTSIYIPSWTESCLVVRGNEWRLKFLLIFSNKLVYVEKFFSYLNGWRGRTMRSWSGTFDTDHQSLKCWRMRVHFTFTIATLRGLTRRKKASTVHAFTRFLKHFSFRCYQTRKWRKGTAYHLLYQWQTFMKLEQSKILLF